MLKFKQDATGIWVPYRTNPISSPEVDLTLNNAENQSIDHSDSIDETPTETASIFNFEQAATPAEPDYNAMPDDELGAIALQKGIDITDKTRRQVINLLKKSV